MSAPQLSQYASGQAAAVSGDQFNTFIQSCDTIAQLRAFVGTRGMQVLVRGAAAAGDGGGGSFYWVSTATGPDDNASVIVPPAAAIGAWVLLPGTSVPSSLLGPFYIGAEGSPNGGTLATTPVRLIFRPPYAFSVTDVRVQCSFNSGAFTVITDVRKGITLPASVSADFTGGTSILTTQPIMQAAETTSLDGTPAVVNAALATLASDQLCGIRCTFSVAPTVLNFAGLKVLLVGAVG